MRLKTILLTLLLIFVTSGVYAGGGYSNSYKVTITNITKNMIFTPFIVATHTGRVQLFTLGEAASDELAALAEGGATGPLGDLLKETDQVRDISGNPGELLGPGQSAEIEIKGGGHFRKLSLAAMLLPTNDTFVSLNGVALPRGFHGKRTYLAKAYDAGSEFNDESCDHIPGGADCGGEGGSPDAESDEGYVYPSPGIHGEGDLSVAEFNWTDPVAKVVVRRMH